MAEPKLVLWEQYEITEEQVKSLRLSWHIRDWNAGIFCLGTGPDIRPEDEELRWCMIVSAYGENEDGRCFRVDAPNDLGTFNNLFDALVAAEQNAIKRGLIPSNAPRLTTSPATMPSKSGDVAILRRLFWIFQNSGP